MLKNKKILVTGPAGNIGYPLARTLAADNEVWGISRFSDKAEQEKVDALGVTTRAVDIGSGEFGDLPTDFDYVLHLSAFTSGDDFYRAVQVNGQGTAMLMNHCRNAKAFLSMSSTGVYRPAEDPWHPFKESDPLGGSFVPGVPFYSISKVVQESIATAFARQLGLPTVISRMNAAYGETGSGGMPGRLFDLIREDKPVTLRWNPNPYSVIHDRDIFDQTEAILSVADTSAPIINWGGDEAVPAQDICAFFGEFLGKTPEVTVVEIDNTQRGVVLDNSRRMAVTGPCKVAWRDGMRELAEAHAARA